MGSDLSYTWLTRIACGSGYASEVRVRYRLGQNLWTLHQNSPMFALQNKNIISWKWRLSKLNNKLVNCDVFAALAILYFPMITQQWEERLFFVLDFLSVLQILSRRQVVLALYLPITLLIILVPVTICHALKLITTLEHNCSPTFALQGKGPHSRKFLKKVLSLYIVVGSLAHSWSSILSVGNLWWSWALQKP